MTQIASPLIRRLTTATFAAGAAMAVLIATPAAAEIQLQFGFQDRDVARMVSLGGSCNRCELSGRDLTGAAFHGATFLNATLVGSDLRGAELVGSNFSGSDFSRADLDGNGIPDVGVVVTGHFESL